MNFTRHAEIRTAQRGISSTALSLVTEHGEIRRRRGAMEMVITERAASAAISELKHQIKMIERMKNKSFVVDGDTVITAFHAFEKRRRDQ